MSGNNTLKKATAGLLAFVLAAGMMPVSAETISKDGTAVVAVTAESEKNEKEIEIWSGKGKGTKAILFRSHLLRNGNSLLKR